QELPTRNTGPGRGLRGAFTQLLDLVGEALYLGRRRVVAGTRGRKSLLGGFRGLFRPTQLAPRARELRFQLAGARLGLRLFGRQTRFELPSARLGVGIAGRQA